MQEIDVNIEQSLEHEINGEIVKGYGVSDYNELENKPSINGVELIGDKTTADLGIEINAFDVVTKEDLEQGLNTKQDKGDYALKYDIPSLEGLATEQSLMESLAQKQDKGNYALKDEIPDLTDYVKKNVLTQYSKTVSITQADYDALETKDSNTLYLIEE